MRKTYLNLPPEDAVSRALSQRTDEEEGLEFTDHLEDACCIVSPSTNLTHLEKVDLPKLRFLQIIDCGSGEPFSADRNITVANTSPILAPHAAEWAVMRLHSANRMALRELDFSNLKVGIIGFGTLGAEIASITTRQFATTWIADIRTPRQLAMSRLGVRRLTLDFLLSKSDVVFVAVHHGPTADPLLSSRESRLMEKHVLLVVNASDHRVLEHSAFDRIGVTETDDGEQPIKPQEHAEEVASFIARNIQRAANGERPAGIVETLDFPSAGDPAFWSSRMSPTQRDL